MELSALLLGAMTMKILRPQYIIIYLKLKSNKVRFYILKLVHMKQEKIAKYHPGSTSLFYIIIILLIQKIFEKRREIMN